MTSGISHSKARSSSRTCHRYQLATINRGITDSACDNLFIGKVVCLGLTSQDCYQTGDTCFSVATAAGIPLNTLLADNPNVNTDCTNVYPGEVNKI
ncbi:carbohydrate-binding module family 50 protein [Suillus luteus UH-Slu-Lm8-n1]|uniref:Carbohydrate-binding module family 50 protein n=1 Tax=Suillus luteus UH-Slu-Lm8-n1 TaxID=930992 RepID=A0A0D0AHH5_9AGAM|nr:carbohydrate-binding module family 50 protein [Suillus luteus UH-Slu-Lm8-n1]